MAALEGAVVLTLTVADGPLLSGDILHTRSLWRAIDDALLHTRTIIGQTVGGSEILHTRSILGRLSTFDLLHTRVILDPTVADLWNDDIQRPIGRVNIT